MQPELPEEGSPEYWLTRARSVLRIAQMPYPAKEALPADLCYLAQQAAEKSLKGVCEHLGVQPPYTHDLKHLVDLLAQHVNVPAEVAAAEPLTRYAVAERYLGALDAIDAEDLAEAIVHATAVVTWAAGIIEPPADPTPDD